MLFSFKKFSAKKSLYVNRPLINKNDIRIWAGSQGFNKTVEDMHVTEAFSREPVAWGTLKEDKNEVKVFDSHMEIKKFGDAYVIAFKSPELSKRWQYFKEHGCSYDHGEYIPHITLSYHHPSKNLEKTIPYNGILIFGKEIFKEVDNNYKNKIKEI